jgi:hypothetical protein
MPIGIFMNYLEVSLHQRLGWLSFFRFEFWLYVNFKPLDVIIKN